MYSTPSRSSRRASHSARRGSRPAKRGRRTYSPQSNKTKLDGHFENGQWFCNCDPRLPAVRLEVKKDTPNKGKWFYVCQQEREAQCGFFIFEDKAKAREEGSLFKTTIGPSPAAIPDLPASTPTRSGNSLVSSGMHAQRVGGSTLARTSTPPIKKEPWDDGESDFGGELSSDEERQMMRLADQSSQRHGLTADEDSQTEQGSYTTPVAQRTRDVLGGLPTPVSRNMLLIASDNRDAKRKQPMANESPAVTPSTDGTLLQTGAGADGDDYDITEEVMGILRPARLDESVRQAVRDSLNRHALRMRGVERGREMARSTLKAKDSKIAELQTRVAALENERKIGRDRIRALHAFYQDDAEADGS